MKIKIIGIFSREAGGRASLRDLGYAIGAVISGLIADLLGVEYAIFFIGGLTIVSSLVIRFRMPREV